MKKTALLAAVAAAFVATPAFAGGHVGVSYGNTDASGTDGDTWQVEGAWGGTSGALGFQLDAGVGNTDAGSAGDIDDYTIAGHLYWHNDNWNVGGVIATTNLDGGGASNVDETVYGVEGSINLAPNAVLLGSYTVGQTEFLVDLDSWNFDVGLNYYFTDNFRVSGNVGTGNLDAGGGADFDTTTWGINAEWQLSSTPVSFTAGYSSLDADTFGDFDTFKVGVRWNWGGTLRDRDNTTPFETQSGLYQRVYGLQ
ncbi:MAG: porin [Hyphomonadaceae bacterium]|nr:porin [Hyphomonadaceae bacterium]MCA8885641.1 porin [Hyphomonadaceae bacterium]